MCEALDGHEDSVSFGGRPITNFRFADDIVVNEKRKKKLASWWNNHHKVQNEDRSRKDKSDDKQSKWLPKRDQHNRSEARRSEELQVPSGSHL